MGSLGNPKTWVPYINTKDCTQGFCSLYCPQWCYIIFPPPPPPFEFPDDNSGPNFSPLVIAIIGILASAFLLISYYVVVSKYCGNIMNSSRRTINNGDPDGESEENHGDPSLHDQPWHVSTNGLDESLIKSISICKYKKRDGVVEGTEHCSVCLSEFLEDESLRLLPNCSHAFHLPCIDTWLKSHSNCPLCRADIVCINANSPPQLPLAERPRRHEESSSDQDEHHLQLEREDENQNGAIIPKIPLRAFSDLGNLERRESIIEIREEGDQGIRRSVSMDYLCRSRISVTDVLRMNQDEEDARMDDAVGSSKQSTGETSKYDCRGSRVLHYVLNPVMMKRSFSSGKFFFRRQGREQDAFISV